MIIDMMDIPLSKYVTYVEYANEEQWLNARITTVGGSEVSQIIGISPWGSKYSLWMNKVNGVKPAVTSSMQRGLDLEKTIFDFVANKDADKAKFWYPGGKKIAFKNAHYPFAQCTPDFLFIDEEGNPGVGEIKVVSSYKANEWDEDNIPPHVASQIIWNMAVCGLSKGMVVAYLGNELVRVYKIKADKESFSLMYGEAKKFMEENVAKNIKPEMEGTDILLEAKWIRDKLSTSNNQKEIESNKEIEDKVFELDAIKSKISQMELDKTRLEVDIKKFMDDAAVLRGPWGKITWKTDKASESFDYKKAYWELSEKVKKLLPPTELEVLAKIANETLEENVKKQQGVRRFLMKLKGK